MGHFHHNEDHEKAHSELTSSPHKAKLSHELIAAAASYEAAKAYNEHCKKNGVPTSHEKAKEIFAGLAGGVLDRLIETKGLDFIDKQKAKKDVENYGTTHFKNHY